MESRLKASDFVTAREVYEFGAYSKSFAMLTLDSPLPSKVEKGTELEATDLQNRTITGKALSDATDSIIQFQYPVSEEQANHVACRVGANPNPLTDGCLQPTGKISIPSAGLDIAYTYSVLDDNRNGRTIQGFSTDLFGKLGRCDDQCPYADFIDYYGQDDYADEWVTAAFEEHPTSFTNGNENFSTYTIVGCMGKFPGNCAYSCS